MPGHAGSERVVVRTHVIFDDADGRAHRAASEARSEGQLRTDEIPAGAHAGGDLEHFAAQQCDGCAVRAQQRTRMTQDELHYPVDPQRFADRARDLCERLHLSPLTLTGRVQPRIADGRGSLHCDGGEELRVGLGNVLARLCLDDDYADGCGAEHRWHGQRGTDTGRTLRARGHRREGAQVLRHEEFVLLLPVASQHAGPRGVGVLRRKHSHRRHGQDSLDLLGEAAQNRRLVQRLGEQQANLVHVLKASRATVRHLDERGVLQHRRHLLREQLHGVHAHERRTRTVRWVIEDERGHDGALGGAQRHEQHVRGQPIGVRNGLELAPQTVAEFLLHPGISPVEVE